ncbi:hypothetical protein D3C71_1645570 [compost metagenome]
MAATAAAGGQIAAVLRGRPILRRIAVEIRADGAGNHALAFGVAPDRAAQLDDHAHGLVAYRQALGDRILALENMHVGAADRGRGDLDQRIVGSDIGNRLVHHLDASGFDKYRRFHHLGHGISLKTGERKLY